MIIVNADDFGRSRAETDAVVRLGAAGRITSTTTMVFMHDSERAADAANELNLDVGLHLNLSERFTGNGVSIGLLKSHDRIVRFLTLSKYALLFYHPFLRADFRAIVEAQFGEFERLYGRPPTHVDGHQHQHLCANVLVDRMVPQGQRVRRSFSFAAGEKGATNRAYRALIDRALARDYVLTDFFFSLGQCLRLRRMARVLKLAEVATVELMAHPIDPTESEYLMGGEYESALEELIKVSHHSL